MLTWLIFGFVLFGMQFSSEAGPEHWQISTHTWGVQGQCEGKFPPFHKLKPTRLEGWGSGPTRLEGWGSGQNAENVK